MDSRGDSSLPWHPNHPGGDQGGHEGGPGGDQEAEGQEPGYGVCAGGNKNRLDAMFLIK